MLQSGNCIFMLVEIELGTSGLAFGLRDSTAERFPLTSVSLNDTLAL